MAISVVVYPLFAFSVAALAVLSGRTLTHPVVGILGAVGRVAFGMAPALVGLAGIDPLAPLFPIGEILLALWFTVVAVTALVRRPAHRLQDSGG